MNRLTTRKRQPQAAVAKPLTPAQHGEALHQLMVSGQQGWKKGHPAQMHREALIKAYGEMRGWRLKTKGGFSCGDILKRLRILGLWSD